MTYSIIGVKALKRIQLSIMIAAFFSFCALTHAQGQKDSTSIDLQEVVVYGDGARKNLTTPQMGHISISDKLVLNLPVMFGEPDIVKTLQISPGISGSRMIHKALCAAWRQ